MSLVKGFAPRRLSRFAGGQAAACPSLQPLVGKQPFPPPSLVVPDGFQQRGRLNPPLHLGLFLLLASVVAIPTCWQPLIRALPLPWHTGRPSRMLVGIKASQNRVFQRFLCPAAATARAGIGNSSPFIRASASALETLDFHGTREMLWLITGWEEVQSNGLTSSGHISLQMLLPPQAQAPPDDFKGKKKPLR